MSIILALFAIPQLQALAQQTPQPKDPIEFNNISPQTVVFSLLKSAEFFPNGKASATVNNQTELLNPPNFSESIPRQFLWKMRVRLDELQLPLKATYKLILQQGQQNNPFNNVQFLDNSVEIISTDSKTNTAIVQGRVTLQFLNLNNIGIADTYSGQLSVCLQDRNSSCM
ncbi:MULTISPECIES: hypothetical protein [Nostocales]|uniref:Uncharacterized protein n=3 Tax=Nostocales TaxID=1161 RepID=A0A8S9T9G6_9CYAN|nr:hypothetical protein [Tolypothrix bouteillei]KAF3889045.1 hypothetical protein DA73_0400028880 [Tolypothrix bouteillei VB521301]